MIPDQWTWIDAECPNCDGKFLYAESKNEDGAPVGEMRCAACGREFHPVTGVQVVEPTVYHFDASTLPIFTATLNGDFSGFFREPPPPDHVFELDSDGRVISYVRFDVPGQDYPPRWFFFNLLDRMVWKYALKQGLQLEDAITELNSIYRTYNAINVGITVVKGEEP